MRKKYQIKPTKRQLKILKGGWKQFKVDFDTFWGLISATEEWMSKETGIKDIEFFTLDGDWCGIGNASRTMRLIRREELER